MNIDINQAQCLRDVTHFGSTDVMNICTGAVAHVPWGAGEWGGAIFMGVLAVFAVVALIGFSAMVIEVIFGGW